MSYFQATRPKCKFENYFTTGTQKKLIASEFLVIVSNVFEAMEC